MKRKDPISTLQRLHNLNLRCCALLSSEAANINSLAVACNKDAREADDDDGAVRIRQMLVA